MNVQEKEKLIAIEENNLKDSNETLSKEVSKNMGLLAFIGAIMPFLLSFLEKSLPCLKITFLIFWGGAFFLVLSNLFAKKVAAQANVEEFFQLNSTYKKFQDSYHLSLIEQKANIDKLISKKVFRFKISIILLSLGLFILIFFILFPEFYDFRICQ